jgi:hypothetical protein
MPTAVQHVQRDPGAATTTPSATWPSATTAGNLLVAVVGVNQQNVAGGVTITPPAGWTLVDAAANQGDNVAVSMYMKAAAASESGAVTFTLSSSRKSVVALSEWPVTLASPLDKHANAATTIGSATATSGTTATTTAASELWIAGLVNQAGTGQTQSAPTNGFTLLDPSIVTGSGGAQLTFGLYTKTATAVGAASCDATLSASANWAGVIGTFLVSAATPSISPGFAAHAPHAYALTLTPGAKTLAVGFAGRTPTARSLTLTPGPATAPLASALRTPTAFGLTLRASGIQLGFAGRTAQAYGPTLTSGSSSVTIPAALRSGAAYALTLAPGAVTLPIPFAGRTAAASDLSVAPGPATMPVGFAGSTPTAYRMTLHRGGFHLRSRQLEASPQPAGFDSPAPGPTGFDTPTPEAAA